MAYPSVDAPYGLKPVNLIGGLPFAGATRQFPIESNYGVSLFNGDVVQLNGNGAVIITALSNQSAPVAGVIGVFLGCSYTNPATKQKLFSQYYPANTVASDIVAYVCDDPNALFKVVSVTNTTVNDPTSGLLPAFKTRAQAVPTNAVLVLNTGLPATGNSRMGVYINDATSSLPIRIVDVVPETANSSGAYVEFIVKFNAGYHTYNNDAGV
jgi:hypothetical protein